MTTGALNTLVHAFISSRLDYCNSALYGCSGYLLRRLQSILHASARLILRIPKYDHISAQIREKLHWLPISARINFKICLIVRGCLVGQGTYKSCVGLLSRLRVGDPSVQQIGETLLFPWSMGNPSKRKRLVVVPLLTLVQPCGINCRWMCVRRSTILTTSEGN